MPSFSSLAVTTVCLATAFKAVSALVLQELPHNDGLRYSKRGDPLGCLDLKSEESFLWGAADETQAALGNLTVYMPDAQENIISMERFNDMLTAVECTQSSIDMTFEDDDTFAYAKAVWDWVNGEENDTFIMVAGRGACGWNTDHRQPFRVTTLTFDEDANIAHLAAQALEWSQAIHSYTLNVGGIEPQHLEKRAFGEINWNRDLSLDFNHQFPIDTVVLPMPDGVSAILDLSNCSTSGVFAFQFTLETFLLIPKKAEMSVEPQGVALTIAPSFTLAGNITKPRTANLEITRINLSGIQIAGGILNIGPEVVLSVGATVGKLAGETTVEAGVVFSLSDDAVARVDAMKFQAQQSGWTPIVQTTPLTVTSELEGNVKAYFKAELELAVKAFGIGFDMGIGVAPFLAADLQSVTAGTAACGTSDGLALSPSYGVDLLLDAHTPFNSEDDPLFEITLFSLELPLPGLCLPFENPGPVTPAKQSSSQPLSTRSSAATIVTRLSSSTNSLSSHLTTKSSTSSELPHVVAPFSVISSAVPSSSSPVYRTSHEPDSSTVLSSSIAPPLYSPVAAAQYEASAYAAGAEPVAPSPSSKPGYMPVHLASSTLSTVICTDSLPKSSSSSATPSPTPQYGDHGYGDGEYAYVKY